MHYILGTEEDNHPDPKMLTAAEWAVNLLGPKMLTAVERDVNLLDHKMHMGEAMADDRPALTTLMDLGDVGGVDNQASCRTTAQ